VCCYRARKKKENSKPGLSPRPSGVAHLPSSVSPSGPPWRG
jgi:hypothetical protein